MEHITIRRAILEDMDILLQFEQGVVSAERPFDPTLRPGKIHYYDLPEMIAADHIELLVAVMPPASGVGEHSGAPGAGGAGGVGAGGGLIGCGYARIEPSKPYVQHVRNAYLGFMYVLPEHRGKGINRQIIAALKDWSLTKGITEMLLDVYSDNASAIKAYEKAGFIRHMVEMRMGIGG